MALFLWKRFPKAKRTHSLMHSFLENGKVFQILPRKLVYSSSLRIILVVGGSDPVRVHFDFKLIWDSFQNSVIKAGQAVLTSATVGSSWITTLGTE